MDPREELDVRRLRGLLAERRITRKHLAQAAGLNPRYVSRILCGHEPGELAHIKLARGLAALGLDRQAVHAS